MFNLQTTIGGIQLLIPNVGGIATGGVLSVIAFGISMVFTVMVVVWVALSIYAGIRIITSAAEPDGIEAGKKTITNIWIGIAMFLGFLVVFICGWSFHRNRGYLFLAYKSCTVWWNKRTIHVSIS
ncbi:MAG: hypothetical protein UZ20_WS6002000291 [candidate division WS6 bacterium OLB21]|uniref:Uncharacterized protein n=1 Tax=candidate division WS6 bacterium OLB21 TaxID=1617427 RepID=A0A136KKB5_9BACT|nr:MAG: hypothetical protein UZ20_WS6002000291 [candidate division WS6 bacterium OLB21]